MERNFNSDQQQLFSNNNSAQSNPSKLQEARMRKAMQTRVQNLQLSNVIGLTSSNKHSIQFNPITGDCYYIAGSIIVVYNIDSNSQSRYIFSPNKRTITTLCFSSDGRFLAAGEGTCKNPEIIIWDLHLPPGESEKPIKQLRGHKYGLRMIFFSPNQRYLISIGDENDKGLLVWDWQSETRLTQNKLSKVPQSACFSKDGTKFVTCGEKHIKFWQFQPNGDIIKTPVKEKDDAFILEGKSVLLGQKFQDKSFSDCCFDSESKMLYTSTITGQLAIVDENRLLNKWMDLKVPRIFNISLGANEIICACADGIIRVFKTLSLDHIVTFPKTPALLNYNIEKGATAKIKASPLVGKQEYADVIGVSYDEEHRRMAAVYSDRSLFFWDISQLDKVTIKRSFLNHSAKINDLQILQDPSSSEVTFFMTSSDDKTVRIWHEVNEESKSELPQTGTAGLRRNVYSKNLSRIIYMTQDTSSFKFKEPIVQDTDGLIDPLEDLNPEHPVCAKSTHEGTQLIVGSSLGRLSVINTTNFEVATEIQAHDQEICALDVIETEEYRIVATGSRDRQIRIFDLNSPSLKLLKTIDDHSSMILSIKLVLNTDTSSIQLISASVDRQIIFREFKNFYEPPMILHKEVEKISKINSVDLSSDHSQLVVGFDKKIATFSMVSGGRMIKSTETKDDDNASVTSKMFLENHAILIDESCSYIASFNPSDKVVRIRDCSSMSVVSKANCGDTITSMGFTMNNSHLITCSTEGCIHIWKMNADLKKNIDRKRAQLGIIQKKLQDVFKQQELSLGSFWIEDEIKQHLQKQQQQLQAAQVPTAAHKAEMQNESTNSILGNILRPADLMKNDNLPNWAKSKPTNMNQMYANNKNADNPVSDDFDQKPPLGFKKQWDDDKPLQQQYPPRSIHGGKSAIIEDSLNMRITSNISNNLTANNRFSSNFGVDSINERDDDDLFGGHRIHSQIGNWFNTNEAKPIQQMEHQPNHQQYTHVDSKPVGGEYNHKLDNNPNGNHDNEDEQDPVDFNFQIDMSNEPTTDADAKRGQQWMNGQDKPQTSALQQQMIKDFGNLITSSHLNQDPFNLTETIVEDFFDSTEQKKKKKEESISYRKDNGLVSIFDPQDIQGQLHQVEMNIKQMDVPKNFKNIFASENQNSIDSPLGSLGKYSERDGFNDGDGRQQQQQQEQQSSQSKHKQKGKADTFSGSGQENQSANKPVIEMEEDFSSIINSGSKDTNAKQDTGTFPVLEGFYERKSPAVTTMTGVSSSSTKISAVNEAAPKQPQRSQLASLGEEIDEGFDESYVVVQKKEYQHYSNVIDKSFKVILEQLSVIEDLVENNLDNEPVQMRKKVHEKIALKSNKVKAILQNIAFKYAQTANPLQSANTSMAFDQDIAANKDLIENYSKMLIEAMMKKK